MATPPTHGKRGGCGHILGLFYGECEKKSVKNNPSMIEYK